jgi:hypothetical protein
MWMLLRNFWAARQNSTLSEAIRSKRIFMKSEKKKHHLGLIIAGILLLSIGIVIGSFQYVIKYKISDIGTELSEDGSCEILFQMIGEPEFPFGRTKVQVIVKKDDFVIKKIKTFISDDGAAFREANWDVRWLEEKVIITLHGSEQDDEVYEVGLMPRSK